MCRYILHRNQQLHSFNLQNFQLQFYYIVLNVEFNIAFFNHMLIFILVIFVAELLLYLLLSRLVCNKYLLWSGINTLIAYPLIACAGLYVGVSVFSQPSCAKPSTRLGSDQLIQQRQFAAGKVLLRMSKLRAQLCVMFLMETEMVWAG